MLSLRTLYYVWCIARNWYKLKAKFLTVFGDIRFSKFPMFLMYQPYDYQVTGDCIQTIMDNIKPGDIILRGYDKKYLDGMFVPSKYGISHAGIYVGNNTVIHAVAPRVLRIHLIDFCQADTVYVIRPDGDVLRALRRAEQFVNTPYDFDFKPGDDTLYCFLLAARCYLDIDFEKHQLSLFGFKLPRFVGTCYLDQSFIDSDKCTTIVKVPNV